MDNMEAKWNRNWNWFHFTFHRVPPNLDWLWLVCYVLLNSKIIFGDQLAVGSGNHALLVSVLAPAVTQKGKKKAT